jgi:hypothetical protein
MQMHSVLEPDGLARRRPAWGRTWANRSAQRRCRRPLQWPKELKKHLPGEDGFQLCLYLKINQGNFSSLARMDRGHLRAHIQVPTCRWAFGCLYKLYYRICVNLGQICWASVTQHSAVHEACQPRDAAAAPAATQVCVSTASPGLYTPLPHVTAYSNFSAAEPDAESPTAPRPAPVAPLAASGGGGGV